MLLRQIADEKLAQYAYLVGCQKTGEAALFDPERDIDRYLVLADHLDLRIAAVVETHIHADFLSGAREFAARGQGVTVYLSDEGDSEWKSEWAKGGCYRVKLVRNGDRFRVGGIEIRAWHTPGHTPEHLSYLVVDQGGGVQEPMGLLSGDFVFVGDVGRPDLLESAAGIVGAMKPSAHRLFDSTRSFLDLPDHLQVWPAHGAGSACGKSLGAVPQSTVGYERRFSPALVAAQRSENDFVDFILSGQPEPPLYFARMKRLNRDGVPVLGELPKPVALTAERVAALAGSQETTVIDTRDDHRAFLAGHLAGSIHAPLDARFPSFAGSLVDPDQSIVLIADVERIDEAIRDSIRIGLDRIVGYAPPTTLLASGVLRQTESIDYDEAERRRDSDGTFTLDVRRSIEHQSDHWPGSTNIPHTRLASRLAEIPGGQEILVHCATGVRAAAAVSLLEREGYRVVHVRGDFDAWRATDP